MSAKEAEEADISSSLAMKGVKSFSVDKREEQ